MCDLGKSQRVKLVFMLNTHVMGIQSIYYINYVIGKILRNTRCVVFGGSVDLEPGLRKATTV